MKKLKLLIVLVAVAISLHFTGCTQNARARNWGGKATINLPKGQKLINATRKNTDLFYLTRAMRADEQPEIFTFQEDSSWGLIEGKVTFVESK